MDSVAGTPLRNAFDAGWQIFQHELLFVFWALMEVALITPLFLALSPWTTFWSPAVATLWLLLIMLIPFNLSRFTTVLRVSVQRQQIIMVVALMLVLAFAWRTLLYAPSGLLDLSWLVEMVRHLGDTADPRLSRELALFLVIAFVWWRGIALAGRGVDYRDVGLRMRFGILLAVFFVAGFAGSRVQWSVTPFVLLFLFASLVSVVLTRVEQLELSRSGRSFPFSPTWLLGIVLAAAAVALATGVVAGLLSGESIDSLVGWLEPIWIALRLAMVAIGSTFSLLISPLLILLVTILEWLVGLIGEKAAVGLEGLQEAIRSFQQLPPEEVTETGETVTRGYRQLLTALSMLFVILLVSLALGRLFRMSRRANELERRSVGPFEGLGRPQRSGLGKRILDRLNAFRRWRAAASIRQTYRAMCAAAAHKGFPRAESETANEYLPSLAKAWPGMRAEIELITEAYNRAHYGEVPETEEELQQILAAWQRLSSATVAPNSSS